MSSTYFSKRIASIIGKNTKPKSKPKAFKTEQKARAWAEKQKLKDFRVEKINKKYKVRTY